MTQGQESMRKGRRRYTDKRIKAGLCVQCGKRKEKGRKDKILCGDCTKSRNDYMRKYSAKRKGKEQ